MSELVRIHQLATGYQDTQILHDVNLSVTKGDVVGIIGPNGSGKTTLLRTITRILKPWQGSIELDSQDIWNTNQKAIAQEIAVVSQSIEPAMMTVRDYVLLGRLPYYSNLQFFETQHDRDIMEKYMSLTDTAAMSTAMINEISGGERQLAQIARALVQEPKLLLLDEPTAHLDITHQVRILDLINRLNRSLDLTVIMVLHDLNLASEYCNHLVLLKDGTIHTSGTPEDVLTYQVIEDVYKTTVIVERNPLSGSPYILLVTEDEMKKANQK